METDNRDKYPWTKDLMFRLIDELKANPLLWHPAHSGFRDWNQRRAVLRRIASKLLLDVELVRSKIAGLKSSYHQYRRLYESGAILKRKKLWFAYDRLSFLTSADQNGHCRASEQSTDIKVKRNLTSPTMKEEYTTSDTSSTWRSMIHQQNANQSPALDYSGFIEGLQMGNRIWRNNYSNRTWPETMASYVAVMLQQAGERSSAEMRLFHRKLIFLMESFQDGTLTEE